jgi:integrase
LVEADAPGDRDPAAFHRGDQVAGLRMSEKVVWRLLRLYAVATGVPGIAPHGLRHRMTEWYRAGVNPEPMLPYLATYLGTRTSIRRWFI